MIRIALTTRPSRILPGILFASALDVETGGKLVQIQATLPSLLEVIKERGYRIVSTMEIGR